MFQFNARVVWERILISGGPDLNSTEPQTRRTYLYWSIFTFDETLPINPEIVCGLQKQGKHFFSKALIYLMMMIVIIIIITIINYIKFKSDFLSRQYFEMLILFSYISHNQWESDFSNWDIGTPVSNGYYVLHTIFQVQSVFYLKKKAKLIKKYWLYFDCIPCSWNSCPFRSIRCAPLLSLFAVISGIKKNGRKRGYR